MLREIDQPVEFDVTLTGPVMLGPLPCVWFEAAAVVRYAPALSEMPELFTVHVTLVAAVFRPTASLLARAVVRPL